ncbi:MAG: hypothetical protein NTZ64_06535 [Polaromonas sp.]|nr:hypothetical protein [Polaromonas sp.]
MKIHEIRKNALHYGMFSFFIMISIGYISTNNYSRFFIEPTRLISEISVVLFLGLILYKSKLCHKHLIGLSLYVFLLTLGISHAMLNGSIEIGSTGLLVNVIITVCGILLLGYQDSNICSIRFAKWFIVYISAGTLLMVLIGGLEFTPVPHFNFDYEAGVNSMETLYSQEMSKFFGFGAMAAAFLAINGSGRQIKYFYFSLVLVFLLLSLLGGARGDSIFALALVIAYLVISGSIRGLLWLASILLMLYAAIGDWSGIDNFQIFQRMSGLDGDFGQRDVLLAQSFELLLKEPVCMVFGCGLGYFQSYFGYPFGMYPHNVLVESFIVFGVPISLAFILIVSGGVWQYYRHSRGADLLVLFFVYSMIIRLKSGSVFGDWFFTAGCIYFASVYMQKITINMPIRTAWIATNPIIRTAKNPGSDMISGHPGR